MQASRDLVAVVIKFASGMKHRHDDFRRRAILRRVHVNRDPPTVVGDRHRIIRMDANRNPAAMPRKGLVNGVVHHFKNQVVKT